MFNIKNRQKKKIRNKYENILKLEQQLFILTIFLLIFLNLNT